MCLRASAVLRSFALLLVPLCHAGAGSARATDGLSIRWRDEQTCAAPLDLEQRVTALSDSDHAAPGMSRFEVEIKALAPDRLQLTLRAQAASQPGVRVVELQSCQAARDTVVVLIAMALQPPDAAATDLEERPQPRESVAPTQGTVLRSALHVGLSVDAGSLPRPSAGISVGVALWLSGLRLSLSGQWLAARDFPRETGAGAGDAGLLAGSLGAAYGFQIGPVWAGPALELELGALRGRLSGVPEAREQAALWLSLLAGASAELPLHQRVAARLDLLGCVHLTRPRFGVEDGPGLYSVTPAAVRLLLGVKVWLDAKD